MGSFSIWHWIIVLLIVLLLFGAGKLPSVMGDIAKGVKAFKAGLKDGEEEQPPAPAPVAQAAPVQAAPVQPQVQPHTQPQSAPAAATATTIDPAKPHQG
ncbi:twin-arginine translocase TatA/TatE family subunit [Azospirillum griseum]|uniref:Sec-independent protein translocase protein TatA n=1 Tax=Azospirillum griseum TaxID=2496639 RepID=A0A3S0IC64_9PROT|nr:twin-arginine translocase TatA/TatE family subunit [Azospirillum griseum]RTR16056.1 twin-arginine translocase TatA/TatE family subunit [Azospirillum griseum]